MSGVAPATVTCGPGRSHAITPPTADAAALDGPLVLHAKVDPAVRAEWMETMHAARQQATAGSH